MLVFDRKIPSSSTFEVVQRFGVDANSSGTVRRFESIVEPHPPLELKLVFGVGTYLHVICTSIECLGESHQHAPTASVHCSPEAELGV